jgi:hypothetical protein
VSQVTLARNRSLGGLESGASPERATKWSGLRFFLSSCRHHMVVADVGFCRLALRPLLGTLEPPGASRSRAYIWSARLRAVITLLGGVAAALVLRAC